MGDTAVAVDVGLVEAEQHPVERPAAASARCVCIFCAVFGLQDALLAVRAVLQVRDHELRHVGAGRGEAAGRRQADELETAAACREPSW